MTRNRRLIWGTLAVVVLIAVGVTRYRSRPQHPNVVFLIVIDTLRADRLSCYGYEEHKTRHIDALAERGVLFENALSVGSWTAPSMGAMMTSRYPTQLGLVEAPVRHVVMQRQVRDQIANSIAPNENTMAETFAAAGYHTVGFVNQPVLNNRYGFGQGFNEWFCPVSEDTIVRRDVDVTEPRHATWDQTHNSDPALVETFVEWMDTTSLGPTFVWVHLSTPHKPYRPASRFMQGRGRKAKSNSELYDGEVRATDALIGKMLEAIDGHVKTDDALIVFTSDHGEEFGEHGGDDHGHSLYRECVHVPLLVSAPGLAMGRRVGDAVRLIDIYPTLLGLCGLDAPETGLAGVDLAPALAGRHLDLAVYSEGMLYGSTKRSLLRGDFRLIWDQQRDVTRLYRPSTDAMEHEDVSGAFPDDTDRLSKELRTFHDALQRDYEMGIGALTAADSVASAKERAQILKAMKSLGYVNH